MSAATRGALLALRRRLPSLSCLDRTWRCRDPVTLRPSVRVHERRPSARPHGWRMRPAFSFRAGLGWREERAGRSLTLPVGSARSDHGAPAGTCRDRGCGELPLGKALNCRSTASEAFVRSCLRPRACPGPGPGCSTTRGLIKAPPGADFSADSAQVTVYREEAFVGATVTVGFTVNGQQVSASDVGQLPLRGTRVMTSDVLSETLPAASRYLT